jgi:serine/threonine-protein kinase HipA
LALTLGGRKRKIKRSDFDQFALNLGLAEIVRDNIYKDFSKQTKGVSDWIARSFLTEQYKEKYFQIFLSKLNQIGL